MMSASPRMRRRSRAPGAISVNESTYFPRLDGLRAVAIGCVMVEHLVPLAGIHRIGLGFVGVDLFFVLSGFLITRILLQLRQSHASIAAAAKYFFWRRFLRLVPAFYAAILIVAIFGLGEMRARWFIHAAYLSNFEVAIAGHWNDASHFWTLSVEEQFYLLWFAIIMVMPYRFLLPVSVAFLALANVFRITVFVTGASFYLNVLLPGVCDGLAVGSIVAIAVHDEKFAWVCGFLRSRWTLLICAVGLFAMLTVPFTTAAPLQPVLWMWMTFFAAIIVLEAAVPHPTQQNLSLEWLKAAPLRYIGKISYGIYIWHYFVGRALAGMDPMPFEQHSIGGRMALVAASFAASILIAQISWWAIEQPALRFKRRSEIFLRQAPASGPRADAFALPSSGV
jgi:peptidoglycan/LPS O-acetylase OafA/YrhL